MGFPAIAAQLGIQIGLWAINRYLLDDTKKLPKLQPEGLEFPLAGVGTPLPYVAGTLRVQPVLAWYGRQGATIVSGGTFKYRADMLFELGVPIWDAVEAPWSSWRAAAPPLLRTVWYGDHRIQIRDDAGALVLGHGRKAQIIYRPNGATTLEAGCYFYDGRSDQRLVPTAAHPTPPATRIALSMQLAGIELANIPGYQHRMLVALMATPGSVASGPNSSLGGLGSDPRIAAVAAEVSALGPQPIGLDANPAWVMYDLMCRPVWGLGIDPADVDLASFQAAADTLVAESHGCSVAIQQAEDAPRVFAALEAQTDGVVYESPSTGKITYKLIRGGYDVEALLVMDASNIIGRPTVDDIHERDCPNELRVSFTDRSREYRPDTVSWKKEGIAAARGNQRRAVDFSAPGCMSAQLAATIAGRELSVAGRPLRTIRIKVNRSFHAIELGDVVKVNLPQPEYLIENEIFRVLETTYGQLADGAIEMRLVSDVFDQAGDGFVGDPAPDAVPVTLAPITRRILDEAPYHLAYLAALAGSIPNLGEQRLFALALAEPLPDPANTFRVDTIAGGTAGDFSFPQLADIGPQPFPLTCTVAVAYQRTAEPYDTTLGLVVENIQHSGGTDVIDFATSATPSEIRNQGRHLMLLGGANMLDPELQPYQVGEFIAFETLTDLGGGQFRLDRVHRGLFDTVAIDHAIGVRAIYVTPALAVGQRDWMTNQWARGVFVPSFSSTSGSDGIDATTDVAVSVVGRRFIALPAADMRIAGYDLDGTRGDPEVSQDFPYLGDFKACSRLEGAIDVFARQRLISAGVVVRGDEDTWSAEPGTTWTVRAKKVGEDEDDVLTDPPATGLTAPEATGLLLGTAGHGAIDVFLDSYRTIGFFGPRSWQSPAARVDAPPSRNLLANDSFDRGTLAGWTVVFGTVTIEDGTESLPQRAAAGFYARGATSNDGTILLRQIVDVTGYKPTGLVALVSWYSKNFASDDNYSHVTIRALSAADAVLATSTSTDYTGITGWRRAEHASAALPVGTAKISVDVSMIDSGDPVSLGVTRIRLQLGQMSDELLTNPSFDGNLTGWSSVTNSFTLRSTNPYASRNGTQGGAQGGAFSSSQIKQEPSVPAGFEYGVALLTFARSTVINPDPGEVVLEALGAGDVVLSSVTTGAEYELTDGVSVLDVWERRRLALQLPDGTAELRVRLLATRTAGGGNSGAVFDDFSLRIHKDLDPATTLDFDFRTPPWQPAPRTWQHFHLAYPALPMPSMAWDGRNSVPTVQPTHALAGPEFAWSDASTREPAAFVGYFDRGADAQFAGAGLARVSSIDAYQFTRAAAVDAVDLQASGADSDGEEYGTFERDEPFTVAILFRTDEPRAMPLGVSCGLVGRRGLTGLGWGLRLSTLGRLEAVLQGADGTATATSSAAANDRAPRWAVLVNDSDASTLRLYDADGSATASTVAIGSLANASAPLRIGRDGPASQTGGVQIARVFVWHSALSADDVAALMTYGTEPSGILTNCEYDSPIWVHSSPEDGDTQLVRYLSGQAALGCVAGRYGLAVTPGGTNRVPSADFSHVTYWSVEGSVTATYDVPDPTGLPRGIEIANGSPGDGLRLEGVTMGAQTPLSVVLYARTADVGGRTLTVELLDSDEVSIDTATVELGSTWQRYHVTLGPWADDTPTAILRFYLAGATGSFDLAHVLWADFGAEAPWALQDPGVLHGGPIVCRVAVLPRQLNHEGEILAQVTFANVEPATDQVIVDLDTDSDVPGLRHLATGAAGAPVFQLYDDASVQTTATGDPIDWAAGTTLRGRWNALELPESDGDQVGLVVADSSADGSTYEAVAIDVGASPLNEVWIGGSPNGLSPHAFIHRVLVRAREPKLS